ncbi:MAG TPA: inositol monophosphatase family protein [Bacteriovoracaceae bacterium]|nr:inositol monophosphatase family protein [Bacteriovoracaceae bacterium]
MIVENSVYFVDKKELFIKKLSFAMNQIRPGIDTIVQQYPLPCISIKPDGTPVTQLDLALSEYVEEVITREFKDATFYSEEKFSTWAFPLLALDPLDGTKEYIEGRAEWAVSVGLFLSEEFRGEGWVYNPVTKECFSTAEPIGFEEMETYHGEVSHTEWKSGLFTSELIKPFSVKPVGSIAYKLGRLAAGKSQFVVSKRPKNIWDIAGGTLLCQAAGFKFYSRGLEVTKVWRLYQPPLIWCHPELFPQLSRVFR